VPLPSEVVGKHVPSHALLDVIRVKQAGISLAPRR